MSDGNRYSGFTGKKFTLVLTGVAVILVLIGKLLFADFSYKGGLVGNPFYFLRFLHWMLLWLALWGIAGLASLVSMTAMIVKMYKNRELLWLGVLRGVLPVLLLSIPLFSAVRAVPGAVSFLRGYEKWVEREVDIPAIQDWLASLSSEYSGEGYFYAEDFPEELPEAIKALDPYHMYFGTFEDDTQWVEFEWGNALSHWGIRIGLPGMDTPVEEFERLSEGEVEFRRAIQPGVYIFSRG